MINGVLQQGGPEGVRESSVSIPEIWDPGAGRRHLLAGPGLPNESRSTHRVEHAVDFYLVRHGEAVPETSHSQRPLTPLGREDVERLGRCAAARNVRPSAILHSGILRAQQTAEILAQHLAPPGGAHPISGLLPQDDPFVAKAEMEAAEQSLVLVGHLPHLNRLIAVLTHGDAQSESVEFRPATMVCCSFDGRAWKISWILTLEPG